MGLYASFMEPAIVSFACSLAPIRRERAKIVPDAAGVVLEIGFGSGHNAPFYDPQKVSRLIALEPSAAMRARARRRVEALTAPFEWINLQAEEIPLDTGSVDTVVTTFTLCTIPDAARALAGMRRVLKPAGKLLFLEHGAAPDAPVRRFQDRLDPLWGKLAGGCHLNRDPLALIGAAGFTLTRADQRYAKGAPRFAGFLSSGVAIA
jgi:ubiquinone/menaquinone biosynthesis C-methylase UbiE